MNIKKTCPKCGKSKKLKEFNTDRTHAQSKSCYCRMCESIKGKKRTTKNKQDWSKFIEEVHGTSCSKCGFDNKDALVLHHIDTATKTMVIGARKYLIGFNSKSGKKLQVEIKTCMQLCSNCHLILHAQLRREKKDAKKSLGT